jgi:hypothetical protein
MKVKVSELEGRALNWAVAMSLGWAWQVDEQGRFDTKGAIILARPYPDGLKRQVNATSMRILRLSNFHPIANWSVMGPLIEQAGIGIFPLSEGRGWAAGLQDGPTPLIAAARCFVASKLGDEIEVPKEIK